MSAWVIAGQPSDALPIVGQLYDVRHSRKGNFRMRATALHGEWLMGVIETGVAKAVMSYNVRGEGDEVTVRDVHSYLIEVPS